MQIEITELARLKVHPDEVLLITIPAGNDVIKAKWELDAVIQQALPGIKFLVKTSDVDFTVVEASPST